MAEATSIGIEGELVQRLFTDPQRLLEVLKAVCQAAMEQEVTAHLGAGPHERSEGRRGHRNGTKPRRLRTRAGELGLDIPQVRGCEHGPYHPSLFNKWQRSERALLVACAEMYFQGVSTRNVREVLGAMCQGCGEGGEVSAMTVSRVAQELDEKLASFRSRRLDAHAYPYVKADARYEHVRVDGRVVSQAVLVVAGYTEQGRREVLDWRVGDSESEGCWGECFRSLKDRGLGGVRLVVSDAHRGLRSALQRHFQGAGWQRCQVHFKRELLRKVPKKKTAELMKDVAAVFAGHDAGECLRRGEEAAAKWERASYPAVAKMLREGLGDCLTVMAPDVPPDHRRRLGSTNMLESLMKRLRKRTRVVGVFPGRSSCDRLIGAQLLEVHERWLGEAVATFNMDLVDAAHQVG